MQNKYRLTVRFTGRWKKDEEVIAKLMEQSQWPREQVLLFLQTNNEALFRDLEEPRAQELAAFLKNKGAEIKLEEDIDNIVLITTTASLEGRKIVKYIGPVFAEYVCGVNLFKDFFCICT